MRAQLSHVFASLLVVGVLCAVTSAPADAHCQWLILQQLSGTVSATPDGVPEGGTFTLNISTNPEIEYLDCDPSQTNTCGTTINVTYSWGGGASGGGTVTAPSSPGVYTISVTWTSDCGATATGSCQITVTVPIVHVMWDSPGPTFDGTTWATAFHTIQQGINAAAAGDEVWVAAGTYNENITLAPDVGVYGAFDGTETIRQSVRPWAANLTTIQGTGTDSVVYAGSGTDAFTVLDGFTVTGGTLGHYETADGTYYGGGVFCDNSSPVISNDVIAGNGDPNSTTGGGIAAYVGSPTITKDTITSNQANNGGGIACEQGSPAVTWSLVTGNTATQLGGGLYLDTLATGAGTTNNVVTWNTASSGGGIYASGSDARVADNAITNNTASGTDGGGVYVLDDGPTGTPLQVLNNTIIDNTSPSYGGGIVLDSSSSNVVNNVVASNETGQVEKLGSVSTPPTLNKNCIYGDTPYSGWSTNPAQDLLSDPQLNGYHLQTGSPCLDAGDNTVVQAGDVDIDNETRIQPTGGTVDIGADEYDSTDVVPPAPVTETDLDYFSSLATYCGN